MNTITNSSCVRNNKQPNKPKIKNSLVEVCSRSKLEVILKNKVVFKINNEIAIMVVSSLNNAPIKKGFNRTLNSI